MSDGLVRLVPGFQALAVGDNAIAFGQKATRYLVRNTGGAIVYVERDAAATTESAPLPPGAHILIDAAVTVLHLYVSEPGTVNDPGVPGLEVEGWAYADVGLHRRGAHDPFAPYTPGDVVTDGGGLYVNTTTVTPQIRVDTFDRFDQDSWGRSSGGEAWSGVTTPTGASHKFVQSATGRLFSGAGATPGNFLLLGPALGGQAARRALLVRFRFSAAAPTPGLGAWIALREDADHTDDIEVYVNFLDDDHDELFLDISSIGFGDPHSYHTPERLLVDTSYWLRLAQDGHTITGTFWADGEEEPSSPTFTCTTTLDVTSAGVGLGVSAPTDCGVIYESFYAAAPLPPPLDDPTHWQVLVSPAPAVWTPTTSGAVAPGVGLVVATTADLTLTLPVAAAFPGRIITFVANNSGDTNVVSLGDDLLFMPGLGLYDSDSPANISGSSLLSVQSDGDATWWAVSLDGFGGH